MTETVNKLAGLEDKAVELIDKFESIAEQHGPQAIELGLDAVRVIGLQYVVGHVLVFLIMLSCIYLTKKMGKVVGNCPITERWNDFWPCGPFGLLYGVSIFFGGILLVRLFNIWGWVALFYPELWLVGKFFR